MVKGKGVLYKLTKETLGALQTRAISKTPRTVAEANSFNLDFLRR
jgi:hypothetical protein